MINYAAPDDGNLFIINQDEFTESQDSSFEEFGDDFKKDSNED
jgi:hypothetical protein